MLQSAGRRSSPVGRWSSAFRAFRAFRRSGAIAVIMASDEPVPSGCCLSRGARRWRPVRVGRCVARVGRPVVLLRGGGARCDDGDRPVKELAGVTEVTATDQLGERAVQHALPVDCFG